MDKVIVRLICIFIFLTSCSEPFLNPKHSPVKETGLGEHTYYFKYPDGCIGDLIKGCGLKLLQEKNLVPDGCQEPSVLKGGKAENGWAYISFQCLTHHSSGTPNGAP